MTDEEILKKAVEKAESNDWWLEGWNSVDGIVASYLLEPEPVIFSHEFAKAFWGDICPCGKCRQLSPYWEYQLQQMVLEENPIRYLEQFLDK